MQYYFKKQAHLALVSPLFTAASLGGRGPSPAGVASDVFLAQADPGNFSKKHLSLASPIKVPFYFSCLLGDGALLGLRTSCSRPQQHKLVTMKDILSIKFLKNLGRNKFLSLSTTISAIFLRHSHLNQKIKKALPLL